MKRLALLLLLICSVATAQGIDVVGPKSPVRQEGFAFIRVEKGITLEEIEKADIKFTPPDGLFWVRDKLTIFVGVDSQAAPGNRRLTIGLNEWKEPLAKAIVAAQQANVKPSILAALETADKESADLPFKRGWYDLVIAGTVPQPPTPPTPPVPPVTLGKRTAVIIYESGAVTVPFANLQIQLRDKAQVEYLKQKGHKLFFLDKDSKDENNQPLKLVKDYLALLNGAPLPAIVISDPASSAVLAKGSLDANETGEMVLEKIKATGG